MVCTDVHKFYIKNMKWVLWCTLLIEINLKNCFLMTQGIEHLSTQGKEVNPTARPQAHWHFLDSLTYIHLSSVSQFSVHQCAHITYQTNICAPMCSCINKSHSILQAAAGLVAAGSLLGNKAPLSTRATASRIHCSCQSHFGSIGTGPLWC